MELYNIKLMSKNNKKTGLYLYSLVLRDGNEYFYGESVKSDKPLKKEDIKQEQIKPTRAIHPDFYIPNGIKL